MKKTWKGKLQKWLSILNVFPIWLNKVRFGTQVLCIKVFELKYNEHGYGDFYRNILTCIMEGATGRAGHVYTSEAPDVTPCFLCEFILLVL